MMVWKILLVYIYEWKQANPDRTKTKHDSIYIDEMNLSSFAKLAIMCKHRYLWFMLVNQQY